PAHGQIHRNGARPLQEFLALTGDGKLGMTSAFEVIQWPASTHGELVGIAGAEPWLCVQALVAMFIWRGPFENLQNCFGLAAIEICFAAESGAVSLIFLQQGSMLILGDRALVLAPHQLCPEPAHRLGV